MILKRSPLSNAQRQAQYIASLKAAASNETFLKRIFGPQLPPEGLPDLKTLQEITVEYDKPELSDIMVSALVRQALLEKLGASIIGWSFEVRGTTAILAIHAMSEQPQ